MLVRQVGLSLPQASQLCSTTPAIQMGLTGRGRVAVGAIADLAVLDAELRVRQTFVAGNPALEPPSTGLRLSGLRP
jgi:N-acetylglucosamine-6-phosphate deacetylase